HIPATVTMHNNIHATTCTILFFFMTHPPPRSTLFPTRRSSDLRSVTTGSPRTARVRRTSGPRVVLTPRAGSHPAVRPPAASMRTDRKSTRLNSSHSQISYAVFCLKKKNKQEPSDRHREQNLGPQ